MPPDDAHAPTALPAVVLPPRWVRPLLLVAVWALGLVAVADITGNFSRWDRLPTLFFVLVPVLLLHALFCARLGVERGYAAETGMLPGLLLSGGLMFIGGSVARFAPHAAGLGLLLTAAFAVVRADPPTSARVRFLWAMLAGVFGTLCVLVEPGAWSVSALVLYIGWSIWRGAQSVSTTTENTPPVASARRVTGILLLVALMGVPAAVRHESEFVIVPLSVATGLILLEWCSPAPGRV